MTLWNLRYVFRGVLFEKYDLAPMLLPGQLVASYILIVQAQVNTCDTYIYNMLHKCVPQ